MKLKVKCSYTFEVRLSTLKVFDFLFKKKPFKF